MPRNPDRSYCGAKKRQGEGNCKRPAGWGTDHPGAGLCKLHGGCTAPGRRNAAVAQATQLASELDMEPHDALLWCVRVAAGELAFFTAKVAELEQEKLTVEQTRARRDEAGAAWVERSSQTTLHVWVSARQSAMERLARFSKMAVDAGVAERHVRIAEAWGERLARLLDGVLSELELTAAQREKAPLVVRRHLAVLEGGAQAA